MLGLVLEGGGAKGSYHAGVLKALDERGYVFDGVMGTSIGAVNGAIIAQGDTEKCINLWERAVPSDFVDVDDEKMLAIFNRDFSRQSLKYLFGLLRSALTNKGFSRERIMQLLRSLIDEDKLREAPTDFGVVTVSITDRMPLEVFKEEIPYGHLHDYIMASAYFPAFRFDPIDGKKYIDGGVYDNLPINPLIRRGYDEIIAVRTNSNMPHQTVIDDTVRITVISPSDDIGSTIGVYSHSILKNINMGYFDAVRKLEGHKGNKYYFYNEEKDYAERLSALIDADDSNGVRLLLGMDGAENGAVIKRILDEMRSALKASYALTDYEVLIGFLEKCAAKAGLERFYIYNIETVIKSIKNRLEQHPKGDIIFFNNKGKGRIPNGIVSSLINY